MVELINSVKTLVLLGIISLAFVVFLLPEILFFILVRFFVWLLAKFLRPDLECLVTGEQSLMAFKDPTHANMNLLLYAVMDGHMPFQRMIQLFQERIMTPRDKRGDILYKRLQQYWTAFLGYPFWKTDPNFDLGNHISHYNLKGHLALPSPCREEDVVRIMGDFSRIPWRADRSPWEAFFHNKFLMAEGGDGDFKTLFVGRFNHFLGDGYTLLKLFQIGTQSALTVPKFKFKTQFSPLEKIWMGMKAPWDFANSIGKVLESRKIVRQNLGAPKGNICSWTKNVPVDVIKEIKNHYHVGFAAVTMTVILGAIQRAARAGGGRLPEALGSGIVIPRPNHPGGMALHAYMVFSQWRSANDPPLERLQKVQKNLESLSQSTGFLFGHKIALLGQFVPNFLKHLTAILITGNFTTFGQTNFPVTTSPEFLDGMEGLDCFCVCPTTSKLDFVVTTCGINNKMRFTFMVERSVFATEEIARSLGRFAEEEIQFLLSSTMT